VADLRDEDEEVYYDEAARRQGWNLRWRDSMQKSPVWAAHLMDDPIAEARVEALFLSLIS
jgi:hypothetical protein